MLNKSSHHKDENTYTFKTFSERLAGININIVHNLKKVSAVPEDADTFFGEAIAKWSDLNCTEHYIQFYADVRNLANSFSQLLHHQEAVVVALETHLLVEDSVALEPLFDLVVQLAKDLQADFYAYFPRFFAVVVKILKRRHHDAPALEQAFQTLAYVFKILWRSMVVDMESVFDLFAPLLSNEYQIYINNFAAESFAFLMRKSRNIRVTFEMIVSKLSSSSDKITGISRLFFEMIKGVQHKFHSNTEKVFGVLFDVLEADIAEDNNTEEMLYSLFSVMAKYATAETCDVVWTVLLNLLDNKSGDNVDFERVKLELFNLWISFNDGRLTKCNTVRIGKYLVESVRANLHPSQSVHVLDCCASYVLAANVSDVKLCSTLTNQVFKCEYDTMNVLRFFKMMFPYEKFKSEMQFKCLQFCDLHCKQYGPEVLSFLVDYLMRSDQQQEYGENEDLIDLSLFKKLQHWLLLQLKTKELAEPLEFSLIFLCRHCSPFEKKQLLPLVKKRYTTMMAKQDIHHCILHEIVLLMQLLMSDAQFLAFVDITDIETYVRLYHEDVYCLKIAHFYYETCLSTSQLEYLTEERFFTVYDSLKVNLSSPYHKVRKLTLEILCTFRLPLKPLPKNMDIEQPGVFQLCLDAENIEISFHECRNKIMCLRKLDVNVIEFQLPAKHCEQVVLRYLLGLLRVNFKMIWATVSEIIASYSHHLDAGVSFWPLYHGHLEYCARRCEESLIVEKKKIAAPVHDNKRSRRRFAVSYSDAIKTDDFQDTLISDVTSLLLDYMKRHSKTEKYDPVKNRTLLWSTMLQFIPLVESKSRQISPMLFDFLTNEFYSVDEGTSKTQDIRALTSEARGQGQQLSSRRRAPNRLLVEHLAVFSRFRGPMTVYLQPRLTALYHELLQHLDADVQTVALQCIFSYKHKYITPYKENFERLIDEKTFNNELVLFTLTADHNCPILEEHRPGLIPVLTRLLFGKMQVKTSNQKINLRKNKIIRFLAASEGRELGTFMDLLFKPFQSIITDENCLKTIDEDVDFSQIMPIKIQQGALFTIEIVLKKLAHLITDYLKDIVSTLLILSSLATRILSERHLVYTPVISAVKNLRNGYLACFEQIFQTFFTYDFTELEIEKLFDAIVLPQVTKLTLEGLRNTSLLMKIFLVWSDHPRYHSLFAKTFSSERRSVLSFVFSLLSEKGCSSGVKDSCMLIVDNLLTKQFDPVEDDCVMLPVGDTDVPLTVTLDTRALGLRLILEHRHAILEHLKTVVVAMVRPGQLKQKKNIPTRELNILYKFSEHVNDQDVDQIKTIVGLMFPFLSKNLNRDDGVESNILSILTNLLPKIPDAAASFIGTIARLFSNLKSRSSRKQLCILVTKLVSVAPELEKAAEIVTKLNAWDGRRIDEPDYAERLESFKYVLASLKSTTTVQALDVNLTLMVVHNCSHFITTCSDMSLRDMSSYCLIEVIDTVKRLNDDLTFDTVISHNVLAEIKSGIKAKTQSARDEYIKLLAHLVRGFPECRTFNELRLLSDEEDLEVDFFENIVHIQVHRRSRALRRLCKVMEETHIRRDTLVFFLLPIVTSYLRDPMYAKQHNLVETAVDTMGCLCKSLPWRPYLEILEKYLKMLTLSLENQRLMVKIIVAVLGGFHFDLSLSKSISDFNKKSSKESGHKELLDIDTDEEAAEKMEVDGEEEEGGRKPSTSHAPYTLVDGKMIVEPEMAERIYVIIVKKILPELHKCITNKTKQDGEHKRVKDKYAADEEVLRVPIALAMVHLLQTLPSFMLRTNLPGILMKVCKFVQHRALDIRNIARDTLYKMCLTLGGGYLNIIIRELSQALTRGYQKHVLSFTVHGLLVKMDDILKGEHVDTCLKPMLKIFNNELFGEVAQEKEVQGIVSKLMEARFSKSIESYRLLSSKILNHSVEELINPFKEILLTTTSHKRIRKVAEVLKAVGHGLTCSRGHTVDKVTLMSLTYSLMKSCIDGASPSATTNIRLVADSRPISFADRRPESSLLVPRAPGRIGVKPKQLDRTNNSVLIEFALQLLYFLLKKEELSGKNIEDLQLLDPFIELLTNALDCKYIQLTTLSLQCMCWMLRMQLPSFDTHQTLIVDNLFIILNEFASNTIQGDKFDLIIITFKTITIMLRDVNRCKLNSGQLEILLGFIENDIYDEHRRSTAFTLLKAILSRKLQIPMIREVLLKIQQQSILGECPHNRLQCRQVLLQYLLYYPVGAQLEEHLEFFVTQLNYELESGRQSALEMLALIFSHFPLEVLTEHAGFFYVPLASRLTKDESSRCRHLTSLAIGSLLSKVERGTRNDLYSMNLQWWTSYKSPLRRLASIASGCFVEVETADFAGRVAPTLDRLVVLLDKEKYDNTDMSPEQEKLLDLELFNHLSLLLKMCQHCDILKNEKYADIIDTIFDDVESHLLHGHHWVRLIASKLFGCLFACDQHPFLAKTRKISRLSEIACIQMAGKSLSAELSEQIIKNSVFIARKLHILEVVDDDVKQRDLQWMVRAFCRHAGNEAINEPNSLVKRRSIFSWIAAVFMSFPAEHLTEYLGTVLPTMQRECKQLENEEAGELETHAQEVMNVLKGIVGVEVFTEEYAKCQKTTLDKRSDRKKKKAESVISNPAIAVRKKIKKNLAKSEAKKRKIESFRPTKVKRTRTN